MRIFHEERCQLRKAWSSNKKKKLAFANISAAGQSFSRLIDKRRIVNIVRSAPG